MTADEFDGAAQTLRAQVDDALSTHDGTIHAVEFAYRGRPALLIAAVGCVGVFGMTEAMRRLFAVIGEHDMTAKSFFLEKPQ